jgi:hypothetical protein
VKSPQSQTYLWRKCMCPNNFWVALMVPDCPRHAALRFSSTSAYAARNHGRSLIEP